MPDPNTTQPSTPRRERDDADKRQQQFDPNRPETQRSGTDASQQSGTRPGQKPISEEDDLTLRKAGERMDDEAGQSQPQRPGQPTRRDEPAR